MVLWVLNLVGHSLFVDNLLLSLVNRVKSGGHLDRLDICNIWNLRYLPLGNWPSHIVVWCKANPRICHVTSLKRRKPVIQIELWLLVEIIYGGNVLYKVLPRPIRLGILMTVVWLIHHHGLIRPEWLLIGIHDLVTVEAIHTLILHLANPVAESTNTFILPVNLTLHGLCSKTLRVTSL